MNNKKERLDFQKKSLLIRILFLLQNGYSVKRFALPSSTELEFKKIPLHTDFSSEKFRKVTLEFGSGNGRWLVEYAKKFSEEICIGCEIANPWFDISAERIGRREVSNAKVIRCDGVLFLKYLVKNHSVSKFFINFPDPWHKKKHWKRRVFTEEFWEIVSRKITPNGKIFFLSDNRSIFEFAVRNLELYRKKKIQRLETLPVWYPESKYGEKWKDMGRRKYFFEVTM